MKEYFVMYYYKLNGRGTQDFAYSWGEGPIEAANRLYNKNMYLYEAWVYDNADAYHRNQKSLYSHQYGERM